MDRKREPAVAGGRAEAADAPPVPSGGSRLLYSIDRVHDGTTHRVKDREKAALYHAVCAGVPSTRKELAARLRLRPSTVSDAAQELIQDGLVAEYQAYEEGRSGRPRHILTPLTNRFVAISLYVDSRGLVAVLLNLCGDVLAEESRDVPAQADNGELAAWILDLLTVLPPRVPRGSTLVGASLSLVGAVNPRACVWVGAARWPRLKDLDLSEVQSRVRFPLILLRANEVELDYHLACTAGAEAESAIHLHWGFGIGSAVSVQGRVFTSTLGRFGEIGHMRMGANRDAPCLCGARGCLETSAALWALLPALRRHMGDLPEGEKELTPYLRDPRLCDLPEVKRALEAVCEALQFLYVVFYPDIVLLSGPFTENHSMLARLIEGFRSSLPAPARKSVTISVCASGMPGCRHGATDGLFRDTLRNTLLVHA